MRLSTRTVRCVHTFVVAAVLLAACGGQSGTVGKITKIHDVESLLNGEVATAGQSIEGGAVLSTDSTGSMEFELSADGIACTLSRAAEATVPDGGAPPLRYTDGSALCRVVRDRSEPVVLEAGDNTLRVERTVFRVTFEPAGQRVAVLRGAVFVGVAPSAGSASEQAPGGTEEVEVAQQQEAQFSMDGAFLRMGTVDRDQWTPAERLTAEQYADELARTEGFEGSEKPAPDTTESPATTPSEPVVGSDTADDAPAEDDSEAPGASDEPHEPGASEQNPEEPEEHGQDEPDEPAVEASDAAGL